MFKIAKSLVIIMVNNKNQITLDNDLSLQVFSSVFRRLCLSLMLLILCGLIFVHFTVWYTKCNLCITSCNFCCGLIALLCQKIFVIGAFSSNIFSKLVFRNKIRDTVLMLKIFQRNFHEIRKNCVKNVDTLRYSQLIFYIMFKKIYKIPF